MKEQQAVNHALCDGAQLRFCFNALFTFSTTKSNPSQQAMSEPPFDSTFNSIYDAKPIAHLVSGNKQRARTIFLAQNHMLECGRNMKGTMMENSTTCNVIDDEQHRLVACKKRPNLETDNEIQFEDIYSENIDKLNNILNEIEKTWDTRYTNGRMKK